MRIEAGFGYTNYGPFEDRTSFRVTVVDATSGIQILSFNMNNAQFMHFMSSNGSLQLSAELTSKWENLGKISVHDTTRVKNLLGTEADAEAERIRDEYLANGWDHASVRRQNYGLAVHALKYVDPDQG